jgi:dienelactone hydrolase
MAALIVKSGVVVMTMIRSIFLSVISLGFAGQIAAQDVPPDPLLGESVVFIKNNKLFAVEMETTLFKPDGNGPFPVVVINHGKSPGNNHLQSRNRAMPATREFLQRGYAVVLPMRQGFSKSGGAAVGEGCNIEGNGEAQAEDVKSVVAWLGQQPWADTSQMIMMGQSHGGLTTLAYAQEPHPGFKLFVNFAGGLKRTGGCQWETALKGAYAAYGSKTKVPSLWFYGENDSYFPPSVIKPAFEAYQSAGGPAEMIAYGVFGADAHAMFGSYSGLPIWWKRVEEKLAVVALPSKTIFPQYALKKPVHLNVLPSSGFAALEDESKLPFVRDTGRAGYKTYLSKTLPRAFAIAPNGAWGWSDNSGENPFERAVDNCNKKGLGECKLYSADNLVVWKSQ